MRSRRSVGVRNGLAVEAEITSPFCRPAFAPGLSGVTSPTKAPSADGSSKAFAEPGVTSWMDDAQVAARDLAGADELLHDVARHVDGHGKADALVSAAAVADDGGVDADQFAAGVHQRAAGISGIDGGVGLNEVLVAAGALDIQAAAARGADDAHGDGLADAEGIADGEHDVADAHLGGIADGHRGKPVAGIFSTAISVRGSVPTTLALNWRLSFRETSMSVAPSTT